MNKKRPDEPQCCTEKWVKFGMEIDDLFRPAKEEEGCGIPRGSSVILSGDMGTGKTTFLMQFLRHGISQHKERGIFISLEESSYNLLRDYCNWEFDGGSLVDVLRNGNLIFMDGTSLVQPFPLHKQVKRIIEQYYPQYRSNAQRIAEEILRPWEKDMEPIKSGILHLEQKQNLGDIPTLISETLKTLTPGPEEYQAAGEQESSQGKILRVCIDSLTSLLAYGIAQKGREESHIAKEIRKTIVELRANLEISNITTLFTVEAMPAESVETGFTTAWRNIENFVARGVIQIGYHGYGKGDLVRYLRILKMRGVSHSTTKYAFEIANKEIEWIGELI
jgi:KaiC/GvpD/RAD55 family RecA-like ATPase